MNNKNRLDKNDIFNKIELIFNSIEHQMSQNNQGVEKKRELWEEVYEVIPYELIIKSEEILEIITNICKENYKESQILLKQLISEHIQMDSSIEKYQNTNNEDKINKSYLNEVENIKDDYDIEVPCDNENNEDMDLDITNKEKDQHANPVTEVTEVIDSLIKEIEEKNKLIKELQANLKKKNLSEDSITVPVDKINISIAYPLLILYTKIGCKDEFNKVLATINSDEMKKLSLRNIETILKCIYRYINKLDYYNEDNMSGISQGLKGISSHDIAKWLPTIYENIFSKTFCMFNLDKSTLLDYAIKYFINDYMEEARFILAYIIDNNFYVNYDNVEIINLSIMSVYYGKYDKLKRSIQAKRVLNQINNKDSRFLNNFINNRSYIDRFDNFEEMKDSIKQCNKEVAKKIYEKLATVNKEVKEIYISKNKSICDNDKNNLESKRMHIPIYDMKSNKKTRAIQHNVLWCNKCNRYSLNALLLKEVYKLLKVNEGLKFTNIGGLSEMSPLMIMGYNTTVSRDKRFNLLEKRIIPTLGIKKVVNHINFLINLNKNKVNKDFTRSLTEWEYDLKKLNKKYYL